MDIVRVSREQLEELARLERMYMQYHVDIDSYFAFEEDTKERWIEYMGGFIDDDNNLALAAMEGNEIIGYITGSVTERAPIYQIKKVGLIRDAFVLQQHRRRGVFRSMVEEMLKWMMKKGVDHVEHAISSRNKVAMVAWNKMGFEDFLIFVRRKI
jgi:GNAT superfamily N-acetyltransferase